MKNKISLTQKELWEVKQPRMGCFWRYDEGPCHRECSDSILRLCRKATLFLRK